MKSDPFYMDLRGFYSNTDNVTYMYTIDGYPAELEISFRTTLREECKDGVRMSFVTICDPHKTAWGSARIKSRLNTWKYIENNSEDVNEFNLHDNLLSLDAMQRRRASLAYLSVAELKRKRKNFKVRSILFVSGKRGENFDDTIKGLTDLCRGIGIKLTRVTLNIQDYLKAYSPFSLVEDSKIDKVVGSSVITDELLARLNTYSQGTVGKHGQYWGTDVYSGFPCLKMIKEDTEDNESILITAEAGGGKSYFAKSLVLQILARQDFTGTIMDIEGFEYLPIATYMSSKSSVVVLNMAEGTGVYFDPVEITLTGNKALDEDMFSLSTSFTLALFKTLLGDTNLNSDWVDIVIDDAVSLTYTNRGVHSEDMSTWVLSKGLTLFDVYSTLKGMLASTGSEGKLLSNKFSQSLYKELEGGIVESRNDVNRLVSTNIEYQQAVEMCIAKVSRYFEKGGTHASVFRKRVSVVDIINAKLVVCSFGMAGKSPQSIDKIQMGLMQLCASNISHLRSIFSRSKGKKNFKLWEEFQRWGSFPNSKEIMTTALTGGRKLWDVNIIITNKISDLLERDEFGIFGNITSFAIGCIWDAEVRDSLCDRLSIPNMKPELEKLVVENKDLSSFTDGDSLKGNPFHKAFLIGLNKTVFSLTRMSLPPDLASSKLLRAGDVLDLDNLALHLEDREESRE